jgi:ATP-dependent Zn protease
MTVDGHDLMAIFINWFPMLLLIGVWMFFLRRMQGGGFSNCQRDHMDLMRRQVESLERIAATLEKKSG